MTGRLLRNPILWGAAAIVLAALAYLAFGFFQVQAAFIDEEVNDDFPVAETVEETMQEEPMQETTQEEMAEEPAGEMTEEMAAEDGEEADAMEPTEEAAAEPEPAGPVRVSSGQFHDVQYEGTGDAVVYQVEDGSYVLRLENLDVENGPDLYVYAVAADDAFDADTVVNAGFVNLGQLKGNQGNQTYELPPDFDPEVHRSVSIWCRQFTANFVTAPLT